MKNRLLPKTILMIAAALIPLSCGEEYPWATQSDCNSCYTSKPSESDIIIELSNPEQRIPIRVYKGKYDTHMEYDDSQLIYMDTATITPYYIQVPVNEYYSVVAEYSKEGNKYKIVDGSELKVYSVSSTCNEDCWIIKGGTMDCRLKF